MELRADNVSQNDWLLQVRCKSSSKLYMPGSAYFSGKCATKKIQMSLHLWLEVWDEDVNECLLLRLVQRLEIWSEHWNVPCNLLSDSFDSKQLVQFTEKQVIGNCGITFVRNILIQNPKVSKEVIYWGLAVPPRALFFLYWHCGIAAK